MVSPGERKRRQRKRERNRIAYNEAMKPLLASGASCSTCAHYGKSPLGRHCELDSDFEGYVLTKPTDLCTRHKARN